MKLKIATFRATAVLTGVLLMSAVGIARATLVEGFESGSFSGSEAVVGDASIKTSYFTINATEGTHQMLLTTINNTHDAGFTNQSGSDAVSVTSVASFLGVSTSSIRDGIATGEEGSAFSINLGVLSAGSTITFDFDFLTTEVQPGAHNDFAFYTVAGTGGGTSKAPTVFYDTNGSLHPTSGAGDPFNLESGYATSTVDIAATGTYTLGIGVMDATTTDNPSALLVDNIQVNVPEPSTVAFTIAGAALLVVLRSRIKRTS